MSGQNLRGWGNVTEPMAEQVEALIAERDHLREITTRLNGQINVLRSSLEDAQAIINDPNVPNQQAVDLVGDLVREALEGPADA